ncbi:MAG: cell division protein SepF [Pseudonocardia sp.]
MSTLYRLKAYFGMVPPEDMDAYAEEYGYEDPDYGRPEQNQRHWREPEYPDQERPRYQNPYRDDSRGGPRAGAADRDGEVHGGRYADQVPDPRPARALGSLDRADPATGGDPVTVGGGSRSAPRMAPVQGSLAVDAVSSALRSPAPLLDQSAPEPGLGSVSMSRITTVHPRSYNEARTIGERYRDGIPVIINLTELDDAAAKRLVDFAAGLAFALRGSIDKVTSRVFLLSPAGVDVSAEERRKLAERGFFGQD